MQSDPVPHVAPRDVAELVPTDPRLVHEELGEEGLVAFLPNRFHVFGEPKPQDLVMERDHAAALDVLLATIDPVLRAQLVVLDDQVGDGVVDVNLIGAQTSDLVKGGMGVVEQDRQPIGRVLVDGRARIGIEAAQVATAAGPDRR